MNTNEYTTINILIYISLKMLSAARGYTQNINIYFFGDIIPVHERFIKIANCNESCYAIRQIGNLMHTLQQFTFLFPVLLKAQFYGSFVFLCKHKRILCDTVDFSLYNLQYILNNKQNNKKFPPFKSKLFKISCRSTCTYNFYRFFQRCSLFYLIICYNFSNMVNIV